MPGLDPLSWYIDDTAILPIEDFLMVVPLGWSKWKHYANQRIDAEVYIHTCIYHTHKDILSGEIIVVHECPDPLRVPVRMLYWVQSHDIHGNTHDESITACDSYVHRRMIHVRTVWMLAS